MNASHPVTLVHMLIRNSAEVRAVVADRQASLTLQTEAGLMQIEIFRMEDSKRRPLTDETDSM